MRLFLNLSIFLTGLLGVNLNAQVSGVVFKDYNFNGTRESGTFPNEPFLFGVKVNAYNNAGALIATKTTNLSGAYGFSAAEIPSGQKVRLEFMLPDGAVVAKYANSGISNNTSDVQFPTAPATNQNLAVASQDWYSSNDNPLLATNSGINGDPNLPGTSASNKNLFIIPYKMGDGAADNGSTAPYYPNPPTVSTLNNANLGSVFGLAYQRTSKDLLMAAYLKRYTGFGTGGIDAIYKTTLSTTGVPGAASTYIELSNIGINVGVDPRTVPPIVSLPSNAASAHADSAVYAWVGKRGIGDIDLSDDGTELYVMNMNEKKVHRINIGNPMKATIVTSDRTGDWTLPNPAGAGLVYRPMGLKFAFDKIYVGGVIIREKTTNHDLAADTVGQRGIVYELNVNTGVFTEVLRFGLNYRRGYVNQGRGFPFKVNWWCAWQDNGKGGTSDPILVDYNTVGSSTFTGSIYYPQPMLSDIEFDDKGEMIVALRDRFGDQQGYQQFSVDGIPTVGNGFGSTTNYFKCAATGEVLRAGKNATSGTFALENNGVINNLGESQGVAGNQSPINSTISNTATWLSSDGVPWMGNYGPGWIPGAAYTPPGGPNPGQSGGYFYANQNTDVTNAPFNINYPPGSYPNDAVTDHYMKSNGGLALLAGSGEVVHTAMDPHAFQLNSQGLLRQSNITGETTQRLMLQGVEENPIGSFNFANNASLLGKANSMGEVEILTEFQPIEIGNRVWNDINGNGIQDVSENGIGGVIVALYSPGADGVFGTSDDVLLATTTTSATVGNEGYFYFNALTTPDIRRPANFTGLAGTNPIIPGFPYQIRVALNQSAVSAFNKVTVDNNDINGLNNIDSDAILFIDAASTQNATIPFSTYANNHSYDIGLSTELAKLGNKVWLDMGAAGGTAKDGLQQPGEPGVAGVVVTLYDATNKVVGSTKTDAAGNYLFENLLPGAYTVGFTLPANYAFSPQTNNVDNEIGTATTGSDVSIVTGRSYSVNISSSEAELDIDAGIIFNEPVSTNSIGDKVWFDQNGNGLQDPTEPGLSGIVVTLFAADGTTVIAVTTTDATGNYLFKGLPANTNYIVGFGKSPGLTFAPADQSGSGLPGSTADGANDSDPSIVTGKTGLVNTGVAGTKVDKVDAGLVTDPKGSIGNFVWNDLDKDGIQDAGEPGISGVTVRLYKPGSDGTVGTADDVLVATTTTNQNGLYFFGELDLGAYFVTVTPLAGYTTSPKDVIASNPGSDTKDSDFQTGTGTYASVLVSPITLIPTSNGGVNSDMTIDLGLFNSTNNLNTIGDKVWYDLNKDGVQDAAETGVANVTVKLLNSASVAVNNPATGTPYIVLTDNLGNYKFVDLLDGQYIVQFTNIPDGYVITKKDATGSGAPGSTTDGADDSDASAVDGKTMVIDLDAAGAIPTSLNYTKVDAGLIQGQAAGFASVGNKVWADLNNNGTQDLGEPGLPNVVVNLYKDLDGNGVIDPSEKVTPFATTTTNSQGEYIFTNLDPAIYQVSFTGLPSGFSLSPKDTGGAANDEKDSDGNPIVSGVSETTPFAVSLGEENLSIDLGLVPPTGTNTLGDKVWFDNGTGAGSLANDGIQNGTEPGIPGVQVTLLAEDGSVFDNDRTAAGIQPYIVTTDANGQYLFVGLPDSTFRVKFTQFPAGYSITLKDANAETVGTDNDADRVSGITDLYNLDETSTTATSIDERKVDAGLQSSKAMLGNKIWNDLNGDGVQDANEPGIPGVTVKLYDNANNLISSTVTDANGNYLFPNVDPGTYQVEFSDIPKRLEFTQQNTPGDNGLDTNSDVIPLTGRTGNIVLVAAESELSIDAGVRPRRRASVGDFVWEDKNKDGIQDPSEPGVAGIVVTLKDASNNTIGTAVTDGEGKYLISNVPIGAGLSITFSPIPANLIFTSQTSNVSTTDATLGSDPNTVSGTTTTFSLVDGQFLPHVDAGLVKPLAKLGDKVWLDMGAGGGIARDGIQQPNEPGVANVDVTLYDTNGNIVGATKTDASGLYLFDDLIPGDYVVSVTLPANYKFTTQTNNVDNEDPGANTGSDVNTINGRSYQITIVANEAELDIDAGLVLANPVINSIGDKVWFDNGAGALSGNGIQDAGEPGVAGVTVTLYDGSGAIVAITVTDQNGNYLFNNLTANTNFVVGFTPPGGTVITTGGVLSTINSSTNSDPNPLTGRTTIVNSGIPGTNITGVDAGLRNDPKGAIGDYVWYDLNKNGIQDAGEPGVEGVEVKLYLVGTNGLIGGGDDILVSTKTTNALGIYLFSNLEPAKYFLTATPPIGYSVSPKLVANPAGGTKDNDFGPGTGTYSTVFSSDIKELLSDGTNVTRDMTIDLGIFNQTDGLNTLGDKVFFDNDKNGIDDGIGATGVPFVTVTLLDAINISYNNPITGNAYVVMTDANGNYKFVDLPDGTYRVKFSNLPAGYVITSKDANGTGAPGSNTDGTTDSDAGTVNGTTETVSIDVASAVPTSINIINVDAGIQPGLSTAKASLGNKVWFDIDNNGSQDANEPGAPNVTVNLYKDVNGDGLISGAEATTPFASNITNGVGEYMFGDLDPAVYQVGFTNLPAGFTLSPKNAVADDKDSDGNPVISNISRTDNIELSVGEDDLTNDLGLVPAINTNTLGNLVFIDNGNGGGTANDGIQQANEPGVGGVMATLLNADGTVYDNNAAAGIQPYVVATDANGKYLFVGLPDGSYRVRFANLPDGYIYTETNKSIEPTVGSVSNSASTDSDAYAANGTTDIFTMDLANATTTRIDNLNADAGLINTKASLGNFVWQDLNCNGVQDAGEPGIPGVTVLLYGPDNSTIFGSTVTDQNGAYIFNNLEATTYFVGFDTYPGGLEFSAKDVTASGGNDTNDSDVNPTTGKTDAIVINSEEYNPNIDAGFCVKRPASVGDKVWNDLDSDGIFDLSEPGIPGIIVTLKNSSNVIVGTSVTDGAGCYLISNVTPANGYTITFSNLPGAASFTSRTDNVTSTDVTLGSDPNTGTGITSAFNLLPSQYLPTVDAGIINVFTLPVLLVDFTAVANGNIVDLSWKVAEQRNVDKYEILHSTDGITFNNTVAIVNANTLANAIYNGVHLNPVKGMNFYKLKIIDQNGTIKFSPIRTVKFDVKGLAQAFPIPTQNFVNLLFPQSIIGKNVTVKIVAANGAIILEKRLKANANTEIFDLSKVANGTYIMTLNAENFDQQITIQVFK